MPDQPGAERGHGKRLTVEWALLAAVTTALAAGAGCWFGGRPGCADLIWSVATLVAAVPATAVVVKMLRRGRFGADLIAVLALLGSLAVGEYLAGALIAVMLASGQTLEAYAARRASKDLSALLTRAPRTARRRTAAGQGEVVDLDDVIVGDRLLVGPGEVVPVDGEAEEPAVLDESVLTGESLLVDRARGEAVSSGVVNAGQAFGLRTTATARDSTYAGIVRLAEQANADRAPMVRLADRYATAFLPLALLLAGLSWLLAGDATRAVAVLVVATPCPLLLATPIAIVSGLSRAARHGVVVRDGGGLENLGRATTLLVDKTGTLTAGRPAVTEILAAPDTSRTEVLRLAAAVEQLSPHVLASAIVREATVRGLVNGAATAVTEDPGHGVLGTVDGRRVAVGRLGGETPGWAATVRERAELENVAIVWVTVDEVPIGAILLHDPVRADAPRTVRRLRAAGFRRLIMLTGDRHRAAVEVASHLGLDDVAAECRPADKVERVRAESADAVTVMVGDGVNDAPALASAHVGVAIAAKGATASAEASDAVLTVDRLDGLADTILIARRARRIAVQSASVGMGLSLLAMAFAAAGLLPPAAGAFLQEAIDVLVILNALRVLIDPNRSTALRPDTQELLHHFATEHEFLRDALADLRATADLIAAAPDGPKTFAALERIQRRLIEEILPHEHAEEHRLYPALAGPLGGDTTVGLSRTHVEIDRLAGRIATHLRLADQRRLRQDQIPDLLASLYGLDAVLRLHFSQEEEQVFSLANATPDPRPTPTGQGSSPEPGPARPQR
ncbi:MAG: cadmium-translocating P-type ATPase [Dactylosporangium sp.]|nr:cadmium-translocating P-type ATPase [Dactylosporangium sp.]